MAMEMNLSETAFLVPHADGYDLRWFTPMTEVDLCGHATLASAHVLWETERLKSDETAHFQTRSGLLTATQVDDLIELDFPAEPATPCEPPGGLAKALGAELLWCGQNRFDYLVQIADEPTVLDLKADLARLAKLDTRGVIVTAMAKLETRGVIVTAGADDDRTDFISRFFCPAHGIDEDPVTGSAHSTWVPWLAELTGRREQTCRQLSARGGTMRAELRGERVQLIAGAVTYLRGSIELG